MLNDALEISSTRSTRTPQNPTVAVGVLEHDGNQASLGLGTLVRLNQLGDALDIQQWNITGENQNVPRKLPQGLKCLLDSSAGARDLVLRDYFGFWEVRVDVVLNKFFFVPENR